MTEPTPREVDDLLDEIYAAEYDYWLEDEEPGDEEPSDDPPPGAEVEHCSAVTLAELDRLFDDMLPCARCDTLTLTADLVECATSGEVYCTACAERVFVL